MIESDYLTMLNFKLQLSFNIISNFIK